MEEYFHDHIVIVDTAFVVHKLCSYHHWFVIPLSIGMVVIVSVIITTIIAIIIVIISSPLVVTINVHWDSAA